MEADKREEKSLDRVATATEKDIDQIVAVHMRAFPGFFLTQLGRRFLREYYRLVLDYSGGVLITISSKSGELAGFVSGLIQPHQFYAEMKKMKWRFVLATIPALLRRPLVLARLWSNFRRVREQSREDGPVAERICELSSIAVDPAHSGKGWGRRLVKNLIDFLKERRVEAVVLTTDASDNESVNRFYLDCGFKLVETTRAYGGRPMNHYKIELEESPEGGRLGSTLS
jgi:ribosomal protein S18 acetylase RimI-like enzyme